MLFLLMYHYRIITNNIYDFDTLSRTDKRNNDIEIDILLKQHYQ